MIIIGIIAIIAAVAVFARAAACTSRPCQPVRREADTVDQLVNIVHIATEGRVSVRHVPPARRW